MNVNAKVSSYRLVDRIEDIDHVSIRPRNVVVWKWCALMDHLHTSYARFCLENLGVRLEWLTFLGEVQEESYAML